MDTEMTWTLDPLSFTELSRIKYVAQVCHFVPENLHALVLAFTGDVPDGSAGYNDSRYMAFITGQFVGLSLPDCVVFDLRELTYTFGDSLIGLPQAVYGEFENLPCIFVASEKCWAGLTTLLAPRGADTSNFLFDDLDAALFKARELAQEFDRESS